MDTYNKENKELDIAEESIAQKLARLRQSFEAPKSIPFTSALALYINGGRNLYLDYFRDFRMLLDWLGPVESSTLQIHSLPSVPPMCVSYEMQQLAAILGCHPNILYFEYMRYYHEHQQFFNSKQFSSRSRSADTTPILF